MSSLRDFKKPAEFIATPASVQPYLTSISHINSKIEDEADKTPEQLITDNLLFVVTVAKQYINANVPFEDIVQYGNIGLCKAANTFDPTRGFKFISYAVWWIRQSIQAGLHEEAFIYIPENKIKERKKANRILEKWMQENEIEASSLPPIETEDTMDIDMEVNIVISSLCSPLYNSSSNNTKTREDVIASYDSEISTNERDIIESLVNSIDFSKSKTVNDRRKKMMMRYIEFCFYEDVKPTNARKIIANEMHSTDETVRSIIVKGLHALAKTAIASLI